MMIAPWCKCCALTEETQALSTLPEIESRDRKHMDESQLLKVGDAWAPNVVGGIEGRRTHETKGHE